MLLSEGRGWRATPIAGYLPDQVVEEVLIAGPKEVAGSLLTGRNTGSIAIAVGHRLLSGSDPQPVSVLDPSSALQTGASPQLNTVPLPTRKPETSTLKRPSTKKASLKRTIKRHVEDEPKPPMQFGNFGYDYVGQ